MKILTRKVPSNFNLFLFGDDHEGSVLRYKKGWDSLCHALNTSIDGLPTSANLAVDHGDQMEGITIDDPRYFEEESTDPVPYRQMVQATINRQPIARQLVTVLEGNHPLKTWRYGRWTEIMCHELGVEYGPWTVKIHWMDNRNRLLFKSYHTHGRKMITSIADDPIRRYANMRLILKRHLKDMAGDCALMSKGHTHKLLVSKPESEMYLIDNESGIQKQYTHWGHTESYIHPDYRFYVNTGSFLRLFVEGSMGYAERAEYPPIEIGYVIVKIRNRKIVEVNKIVF